MRPLRLDDFSAHWVPSVRDGILASQGSVFAKYKLDTILLLAHFMAQIDHESDSGHEMVESLNYSASRMLQVWPSRFKALADAEPFAHNPEKLANKVYSGRMGNTLPGDGWRFIGRGLIQTTGRDGYESLKRLTGLDVVAHPELTIDPKHSLECAVAEFVNYHGMRDACAADSIERVTRLVNGGLTNLADRKERLAAWKTAFHI